MLFLYLQVDYHLYLRYKWILLNSRLEKTSILINKNLNDLPVLPGSEIFYFKKDENDYLIHQGQFSKYQMELQTFRTTIF